ncbi:uncharacterized protein LOC26526445 [Drosophila erecta]|uniref:uncharacterized protein LOC26526445 n=1 Tax=Drosophila erecta TaxID=7220 RepID=UPI0007327990|nr:uncharacterized protein LOC26526445 [Drosophila erecta]KQS39472.1 uncharacterized protein Dere_GG26621 [Drosophila erecta]
MKISTKLFGIILLARLLKEVDGKGEISELESLSKTDAKYTALLKEINSTFHSRPHTKKNAEFEKNFQTILIALNLSMYDIATKIDIYTDFTVYNQIRVELDRQIFKKLQVTERLLKLENLIPKCRIFFSIQQSQLIASFNQSNLMKLEILHDPSPECENVELQKLFRVPASTTTKPQNYDTEIQKILVKYNTRPWGNKTYKEFDEKIWTLFMAINSEEQKFKKEALDTFKKYDDDRAILDKALAHRIGEFTTQIANEKNPCKVNLIRLKKELGRAMFATIQKKHDSLLETNYVKSCLNNERKIYKSKLT